MKSLLVHTATVQRVEMVQDGGYVSEEWNDVGVYKCWFCTPKPSRVFATQGAPVPNVDATVFAMSDIFSGVDLGAEDKIRLVTTDPGWTGSYDIQKPVRPYYTPSGLHHYEIDCVRVQQ